MKLTFFSDTHTKHAKVDLSAGGDVLIFCGDMSARGSLRDVESFAAYMAQRPYKYKIVIAGNHDFCFENEERHQAIELIKNSGAHYLDDSGIELEGIKFWGSPVQPFFHNWAFNRMRGPEILKHWKLIPADTDVLITHGPPMGILDRIYSGEQVGCQDLLERVREIAPRLHAFGHIHEDYGIKEVGETIFINACSVDLKLKIIRPALHYIIDNM